MSDTAVARNDAELIHIRAKAGSANDHSVLMLNLNRYYAHADFPNGTAYKRYRDCLATLLGSCGKAMRMGRSSASKRSTRSWRFGTRVTKLFWTCAARLEPSRILHSGPRALNTR